MDCIATTSVAEAGTKGRATSNPASRFLLLSVRSVALSLYPARVVQLQASRHNSQITLAQSIAQTDDVRARPARTFGTLPPLPATRVGR
jgi:hypothetical protein